MSPKNPEAKETPKGFSKYHALNTSQKITQRKSHLHNVRDPYSGESFPDIRNIPHSNKQVPVIKSSWNLVGFIVNYSDLKKNAKLVSAQIATHYNRERGYAYPSYQSLITSTGLSRTAVAAAIKIIKESNEWFVHATKSGQNNRYYPNIPLGVGFVGGDDD